MTSSIFLGPDSSNPDIRVNKLIGVWFGWGTWHPSCKCINQDGEKLAIFHLGKQSLIAHAYPKTEFLRVFVFVCLFVSVLFFRTSVPRSGGGGVVSV